MTLAKDTSIAVNPPTPYPRAWTGRRLQICQQHSFLVQGFELLHERLDFVRCQLARELRHPAFAIRDHIAQLAADAEPTFAETSEGPPKWRPSAVLP
ncbi:MAG: hypothetical protein WCC85_05635 [Candidatus Sulfotelmatobacter sp.]